MVTSDRLLSDREKLPRFIQGGIELLTLPNGTKSYESPQMAALRELEEEAGILPEDDRFLVYKD